MKKILVLVMLMASWCYGAVPKISTHITSGKDIDVVVNGYVETGASNNYVGATGVTRSFLLGGHLARIKMTCQITKISLYIIDDTLTNLTSLKFGIGRLDTAESDSAVSLVGSYSAECVSQITTEGAWNEITLATPLSANVGDMLIITITTSAAWNGIKSTGNAGSTKLPIEDWDVYYVNSAIGTSTAMTHDYFDGYSLWVKAYTKSPIWVLMGDSFAAGKNGSAQFPRSMMEPLWDATANEGVGAFEVANWETVVNWDRCILGYAEDIDSTIFDYMNCAIGSTTAANWATTGDDYITTYVLPYYPKYAVVSLGYNDSTDWDGVSANIDNVADTLKANSIIPVFITVLPARSSDTAERKAQITSINTGLKAYCLANNIACIDAYERLEDDDTPLQRDAAFGSTIVVHPNSQCYRCIADMLYSATIFDSGANGWLRR